MKKTCRHTIAASRADSGQTMSRRLAARSSPFDASGQTPEWLDGSCACGDVFLMNRFYGEVVLASLMALLGEGVAGTEGRLLAERLGKEILGKKNRIRGDVLWEMLKSGLGTECAARLIAGLDGFGGLGLYDDRVVVRFAGRKENAGTLEPAGRPARGAGKDDRKEIADAVRGCREPASGKEENAWRRKTEKN